MSPRETRVRILRAIYREMRANPSGYGLWVDELKRHVDGDWRFDLRYLVAKGLVADATGYLTLTSEGIDLVEAENS